MSSYGPNTEAVEALIKKVKTITPEQAEALAIVWDRSDNSADEWDGSNNSADEWDEVWRRAIHASEGRRGEWEAAWDAIGMFRKRTYEMGGRAVEHAAWEATAALVVKDLISKDDFHTLYNPWASVMEVENG